MCPEKNPIETRRKKKSIQKYTRDINVGKKDAQLRIEINYPTNHSIRRTVFTGFSSSWYLLFLGCKNGTKTTEILARLFDFFEGTVFVPYPQLK